MDRLDAMSVLLAVVEAGSLSAGARQLGAPLATVSRKVADLEEHLGARLLIRTSRKVVLTDAGRDFVETSRRILEEVHAAERAAAGEYADPRGELTVSAPVMLGRRHVLPIVADFLSAHPLISVRLALADRQLNLVEDHVDLAVRIGLLEDSSLVGLKVGEVRRIVCASPDYLARRGAPETPEDLAGHDGVSLASFSTLPGWSYRGDSDALSVEPRARLSVNTMEAAIDAAVAGLGVVRVLSYQIADELRSGALVPVLEAFAPKPLPVQLVHASQGRTTVKLRAFIDWTAPRLRKRLLELETLGAGA